MGYDPMDSDGHLLLGHLILTAGSKVGGSDSMQVVGLTICGI